MYSDENCRYGNARQFSILVWRYINMAHKIDKDVCVGCGSCKEACPMDAIKADGDKFAVDADACVDCGACESACPTGAIK